MSPLASGHSLILPWLSECRPQALDFHALSVAVRFMDECKDPNSRMLFNSLGGFSSVNHLHFHLLNMTGISPDKHTPIERAALLTPTLSSNRRPGVVLHLIDTSAAGWGCAAFVLESSPTSPIDAITAAVDDIVLALYASGIPFHLLFVTSRKIYVIPRQNQGTRTNCWSPTSSVRGRWGAGVPRAAPVGEYNLVRVHGAVAVNGFT